jgi:hypothetical protein
LLIAVAIIALICAVLARPTDSVLLGVAFVFPLLLASATAVALFAQSGTRGFAGGFAVAAWTYLVLSSVFFVEPSPTMLEEPVDTHFPYAVIDRIYSLVHFAPPPKRFHQISELPETTDREPRPQPDVTFTTATESGDRVGYDAVRRTWVGPDGQDVASFDNFRKIAHRLLALAYGLAGGIIVGLFCRRRPAV